MKNISTNISGAEVKIMDHRVFGWLFAFGLVGFATIFGNIVTIIAFTRGQVQKKAAHILLINLAVTDLTVGSFAVPLYIYVIGSRFWNLHIPKSVVLFQTVDQTTGIASMFSICVLSLERLFAVGWPVRYHNSTGKNRVYVAAVLITWLYASLTATLKTCFNVFSFHAYVYIVVLSLSTPIVVTVISYTLLWVKKRNHSSRVSGRRTEQENMKLARTLLIVTIVFFLTWMPFVVLSTKVFFSCCFRVSPHLLYFTKFLHYGNSCANPTIYVMRIAGFRAVIKNMFCIRNLHRSNNVRQRECGDAIPDPKSTISVARR